jgi:hypothetical protein
MEAKESGSKDQSSNQNVDDNVSQLKTVYIKSLNALCSKHQKPFKAIFIEDNTLL